MLAPLGIHPHALGFLLLRHGVLPGLLLLLEGLQPLTLGLGELLPGRIQLCLRALPLPRLRLLERGLGLRLTPRRRSAVPRAPAVSDLRNAT
ncbi:hypothetical protein QEG98_01965 [Myxococcus sp. MxC21-1]|uniref:hypothetical protein n=1 Tax=Myxococcus sp. MxC21-1 TaxID=3041439 RepID=UPI00292D858D|nr:hypothetical protein [Myxococcus sp. MxC21-1]WNZ66175.1 hypothetical protein QEG98_01965 [Myxococcus sp. MxC21-1]